jgi:hypothetical protein
MTVDEVLGSAGGAAPPAGIRPLLRALWLDARGHWGDAHQIAQDDDSADAAWVHAYLHREEGDLGNAAYWYRRAGRPVTCGPLEDERRSIAAALLGVGAAR